MLWLIVYYIAGNQIPGISNLGDWNILIGMGSWLLDSASLPCGSEREAHQGCPGGPSVSVPA
ncbi:septation inhibitor protein [Cutibacterium acnes JCM 18916]|nr:septation inhibitor protein [Cutibacterium acnes JCM 18916]